MFLTENNNDCSYDVTGINAQFGYNTIRNNQQMSCGNNDTSCENQRELRNQMLNEIRCLRFAITDLGEYLNTHENDERAICLHREYSQQLHDLENKYQMVYGPLTIYFPCNKWRWLEEPWPWERGNY